MTTNRPLLLSPGWNSFPWFVVKFHLYELVGCFSLLFERDTGPWANIDRSDRLVIARLVRAMLSRFRHFLRTKTG